MESAKQQPLLDLWLHDVQSYIYKVTSELMRHARFHFDRSGFSYKRKNKKSQDELSIIFLSQLPVRYRVSFQFEIWHPEIKRVKESYMNEILMKDSNLCSIILFMKNFPSKEQQQEIVKDYSIHNQQDLFMVADWLTQTIQNDLFPISDQMGSISGMDNFFESNPEWSLNTRSGGNICTDLIVAKLNRKRDIHIRYWQLIQGLQQRIENQQMNPESRELLSLCYETIK
jgi:hypothetical protein